MEQLVQFILNHWPLWVALVIIILLIIIDEVVGRKLGAPKLSTVSMIDYINNHNAKVIDLREESAFQSGHILDSIRASEEDFSRPKLEKFKDKPIILVDAKGLKSQTVANKIKRLGYNNVMLLQGGILSWNEANLPLVKGKK